jgi:hypothetical protein
MEGLMNFLDACTDAIKDGPLRPEGCSAEVDGEASEDWEDN